MKKRKILYVIPFAALVLSGCTFQDGINWLGTNIYEPVKNWIVSLFGGKKDEPKPEPEPGPGPQPVDKVYTPDEVIAMCDQVGAGVVVPDLLKVEGTVALGSNMGDHGWEGKFITEGEKDLVFESANGYATEESLDGATIVLEGYAELFNGKYKIGYLPASASPTGSAYSPTLLSVTQPGEKEIKAITSIDVNTLYTISVGDSISKKDVVANLEYTDGSIGQVTPDSIEYDTSEAGENKALTVHVGNWEGTTYITVANLPHYTPEEVIALCDVATEGKVVEGLLRVEGFVENGSTFDEKYGWSGKFAKESEKQLEFGSAATNKEYATLDNKYIQVEGYAELYQGVYKVAYLPASASPTGDKYNPVLVSVETKDVTPESIIITSGNNVGIEQTLLLKASVLPVGSPQDVVWSIESGSEYATLEGSILTGVAQGTVVVKAAVASNPEISAQMSISVGEAVDPMQLAYEAAAALANQAVTADEFEFSGVVVGKRGTDDYFVQSGAYGLDVYKPDNADLAVGKEVSVKATLTSFSGTLETKTISELTVGNDADLPAPVVIDSKATQDATKLNVLAEVEGIAQADVTSTSGNLTMNLTVGNDTIVVYVKSNVRSAAGLTVLNSVKAGDTVKLEKVVTGTYNANKQLLPCEDSVATVTKAPAKTIVGAEITSHPEEVAQGGSIATSAVAVTVTYDDQTTGAGVVSAVSVDTSALGEATATVTVEGYTPAEPLTFVVTVVSSSDVDSVTFTPDNSCASAAKFTLTKDGVTIEVSNGICNDSQIRVYKNQTMKVSASKEIKSISFTCTANGTAKYGPGCFGAIEGYTYESTGPNGTWTGSSTEITFTASGDQVRMTEIVVSFK